MEWLVGSDLDYNPYLGNRLTHIIGSQYTVTHMVALYRMIILFG